jgi:hypothetical protein
MRNVVYVAVLALAGCGRFGFDPGAGDGDAQDAQVCVPVGHDEDGDSIDDACDVCPHISDVMQPDRDGDGVGDLCDPNPDVAGERIVLFDPFTSLRPEVTVLATYTLDGDSLTIDARAAAAKVFIAGIPPANDVFRYGVHIAGGGSGTRQITLETYEGPAYYYCELVDLATVAELKLTYTYDEVTFTPIAAAPIQTPLENADVFLALDHRPPRFGCETSWPASSQRIEAPIPAGIAPDQIKIEVHNLLVRFDYFIQIHTD